MRWSDYQASQYRTSEKSSTAPETQPFQFDREQFGTTFKEIFPTTLENIASNKFRSLKRSLNGRGIVDLSTCVLEKKDLQERLITELQPMYFAVFNKAAESDTNSNEVLLEEFYSVVFSKCDNFTECLQSVNTTANLPVRQFVSVLNRQLLNDLIENRVKLCKPVTKTTHQTLTSIDQTVIFYICGYILRQLAKRESNTTSAQQLSKNENDTEKTFVDKYAEWTRSLNRGGLKVPSDNFFLLIRECEICIRNKVNEAQAKATTYVELKEIIMEDHMVNHYARNLKQSAHLIEKCLTIFVNVRGPAAARLKKYELLKTSESAKSLRKVLKDMSNV